MSKSSNPINVVIASYLEPEYIEQIRRVDERLKVIYRPDLIPAPRYAADHTGPARNLSPEQETEWAEILSTAEVLFDFDYPHAARLPELAPQVKWIQATSAGIGQFVRRRQYAERMPGCAFTTASGVHAIPLAEHVLMVLLIHYNNFLLAQNQQRAHLWQRYAATDLQGRTLGVVGLGRIGSLVAKYARALGMTVLGLDVSAREDVVDEYFAPGQLHEMLPRCEAVVLTVPHTPETEGMIGATELALLPRDAFLINIARGAVIQEPALIAALQAGHLGGAALDVAAEEPLPADSPLWDLPNVIVTPHSASTSDRENQRLTDLFMDNLRRYLDGSPLRNVLNVELMY